MSIIKTFSRRSFIYGANACLALPLLDTFANNKSSDSQVRRSVFMGIGFGFVNDTFYPQKPGRFSDTGLTEGLSPLKKHQDDILFIGNLTNGPVADPHMGSTNLLTAADTTGAPGLSFFNSVSCDQLIAEKVGTNTRYKSMIISGSDRDGHGRGLSLSWDRAGNPLPGYKKSIEIYNAVFANKYESREQVKKRLQRKESILDALKINANSVNKVLGKEDREKIDEYFQSIRQIEMSLSQSAEWLNRPKPAAPFEWQEPPHGEQEMKMILDLIALALQNDSSRVITYRMHGKSLLESMGISIDPHGVSHYGISADHKIAARNRDKKITGLFSYFLDRLKEKKDVKGQTLFDTSTVYMSSNLRWGHVMKNIPMFISGRGIPHMKSGEFLALPEENTPLANLWLTILQKSGVEIEEFGVSTGTVKEIFKA